MADIIPITAQANEEVRGFLKSMKAARQRRGTLRSLRPNAPYVCIEDFVLRHGQAFATRIAPPEGLWPGIPHCCYQNSAILATVCPERFTYVEGFAVGEIPVHHAWVQDTEGRVLDITWPFDTQPSVPPAYWGVAFSTAYVQRTVMAGKGCVLDNYMERFPLLTGAHGLETALHGGKPHGR